MTLSSVKMFTKLKLSAFLFYSWEKTLQENQWLIRRVQKYAQKHRKVSFASLCLMYK
jgi:hypothetical protein